MKNAVHSTIAIWTAIAERSPFIQSRFPRFVRYGQYRDVVLEPKEVYVHRVACQDLLETDELCTLDAIQDRVCYNAAVFVVLRIREDKKRLEADSEEFCFRGSARVKRRIQSEDSVDHEIHFRLDIERAVVSVVNGNHKEAIADGKREQVVSSDCL